MASLTSTSGGNTPVDSTETGNQIRQFSLDRLLDFTSELCKEATAPKSCPPPPPANDTHRCNGPEREPAVQPSSAAHSGTLPC